MPEPMQPFQFAPGFCVTWPDDNPAPNRRAARRIARGTHRYFQTACRVEPSGDLGAFAAALGKACGDETGTPTDESRSLLLLWNTVDRSPSAAIESSAWQLRRWLRKAGLPVARVSWDVRAIGEGAHDAR